MTYKRVVREDTGREMYYRDGRLVKKESIPPHILATLEPQEEKTEPKTMADIAGGQGDVSVVDESSNAFRPELSPAVNESPSEVAAPPEPVVELPKDVCVFCGQPASTKRFINGQKVALCQEDYNNKTTGETAAAIREFIQTKA